MLDVTGQEVLEDGLNLGPAKFGLVWNSGLIAINTWNVNGYISEANMLMHIYLTIRKMILKIKKEKWADLHEPGYTKHLEGVKMARNGLPVTRLRKYTSA